MSEFTQQTFLGCTIVSFTGSVGWGSQTSTLNVTLVEDKKEGQYLNNFATGYPTRFSFGEWTFDGLVNSITPKRSISGNRIIDVTLTSPTEVLKGVQIVAGGYISDIAANNIYNVYAYWENNLGYGGAETNENGILWGKVTSALNTMIGTKPITHKGYSYLIDLTSLPVIPSYYRMQQQTFSLYDFIEEICEIGGCDFFIEMYGNVIKVQTVDRTSQPALGKISQFIEEQTALGLYVSSNNIGIENEYNTTTKVVIGGPREDMFITYNETFEAEGIDFIDTNPSDDMVVQYWGLDANGNAIMQYPYQNPKGGWTYAFVIDGYPISIPGGIETRTTGQGKRTTTSVTNVSKKWRLDYRDGYPTDEDEIRAAMVSQDSWEAYLLLNDYEKSIHAGKVKKLGIGGAFRDDVVQFIEGLNQQDLSVLTPNQILKFGENKNREETIARHVWRHIKAIGETYYGKKFMVRIPYVYSKTESETGRVVTSLQPTESGYLEDENLQYGINQGYLPFEIDRLLDENGKLTAFAEAFYIAEKSGDIIHNHVNDRNFFKVSVDPDIVFLNKSTLYSPRAVINAPIFLSEGERTGFEIFGPLYDLLKTQADNNGFDGSTFVDNFFKQAGSEGYRFPREALSAPPRLVGVPLKSNINNYGPWGSTVGNGKAEVEINNSLVPWNFGGYTELDRAGNAMVSNVYSNRFTGESGSIEVAGSPSIRMGQQLILGGPYLTDINVTVDGNNGVKTTYRMNRWNTDTNKILQYNIERFKELNRLKREINKKEREKLGVAYQLEKYRPGFYGLKKALQGNTSNNVLMANTQFSEDFSSQKTNVVSSPNYNAETALLDNTFFPYKAVMSMDGLFRPFSTNPSEERLPHFEIDENTPLASSLNPFKEGTDIQLFTHGQTQKENLREDIDNEDIRALGLRAPLVLVGYGYDTTGKPVPNEDEENPTDNFAEDYLTNQTNWKAGPLDARWDHNKKCWIASSNSIKKIYIPDDILTVSGIGTLDETGEEVDIYNMTLESGVSKYGHGIPGETYILAVNAGLDMGAASDSWVPVKQEYFAKRIFFQYNSGTRSQNVYSAYDGVNPPTGILSIGGGAGITEGLLGFTYDSTNGDSGLLNYTADPIDYITVLTGAELHPTSGLVFHTKDISIPYRASDSITVDTDECI